MIMPAIALAFPVIGQMTRIVRTAMVEELDKDYVQTARGSGIPENVVIAKNVLRNALITPITTLGLKIGYLMGGAVVIEVIFALPGMGTLIPAGHHRRRDHARSGRRRGRGSGLRHHQHRG